MKLKTVIFMVLVIVMVIGAVCIVSDFNRGEKELNFELETIKGEPASLAGTELSISQGLRGKMVWNSHLNFSGEGRPEVQTEYKVDSGYGDINYVTHDPYEIKIGAFFDTGLTVIDGFEVHEDVYIPPIVKDLSESVKNDAAKFPPTGWNTDESEGKLVFDGIFRIADYMDHYIYDSESNISLGIGTWWDISEGYGSGLEDKSYTENMKAFIDFFSFPVLDNQYCGICMREKNGQTSSQTQDEIYEIADSDAYTNLYMKGVMGDGKVFLSFDNRTEKGNRVDTSEIPGGYGIYACDNTNRVSGGKATGPDFSTLRNVLPLDEKAIISKMIMSSDKKYLQVYTIEEGDMVVRIMNTETCGVTFEETIWKDVGSERNIRVYSANDLDNEDLSLSLIVNRRTGFKALKDEDGYMKVIMTRDFNEEDGPDKLGCWLDYRADLKMSWDGSRLVLAALRQWLDPAEDMENYGRVIIGVYSDDDLEYLGVLKNDLNRVLIREDYGLEEYVRSYPDPIFVYQDENGEEEDEWWTYPGQDYNENMDERGFDCSYHIKALS